MADNIDQEVADLRKPTVEQLRGRHQQLSILPPRVGNKDHLVRRIAWWLQALPESGLRDRARQRAEELAGDAELLATPPQSPANPAASVAATITANQLAGLNYWLLYPHPIE
jgi:hypothetical protein